MQLALNDVLYIRLIIVKNYNNKLKYKMHDLFKIQIFKNRLKNNRLLKPIIVNKLLKKLNTLMNNQNKFI